MSNELQPDKPFKTVDEQIDILESRGLVIKDRNAAKNIIFMISYYDLVNGYKDIFMIDDNFRPNLSIEYLYLFSRFDRNIQNILFKYSVIIETSFKNALAYIISKNYGVLEDNYLSPNNYLRPNHSKTISLLNSIRKVYEKSIDSIEEPTKHYKMKKNHIPPWILFKNITFDQSIRLYKLLRSDDKMEVCSILLDDEIVDENKKEVLFNSLSITRRFRNKIAHNLKFITYKDNVYNINRNIVGNSNYQNLFDKNNYNNVYAMIICMNILMRDYLITSEMNSSIIVTAKAFAKRDYQIVYDYMNATGIPTDFESKAKLIEDLKLKNNYPKF
ncbi:Abi family protein [Anaerococcus cruorum]|uniref:Abi family protein n=1 Tax=Anaerococcus cruorum TaxID=3115617 RepID=A0ABW9MUU7_9FIRM